MLKIYINKANESWVVDRFRKEFISHNPQITTKLPNRSNVVWIISPWTWGKLSIKTLNNSKVICTIHHLENKDIEGNNLEDFLERDKYVDKYHVISKKTIDNLIKITNKEIVYEPFWINQNIFYEIDKKDQLRKKYNINDEDFVIGSFQRDSEGHDSSLPKLIKGPDRLIEIISFFKQNKKNLRVILSGYRRDYIVNELNKENISFDYFENTDLKQLNELYNILDLYIVSSRIEGGPQAILESAITKTPIISTNVGIADEILSQESIFDMGNYHLSTPNVNFAFKNAQKFNMQNQYKKFIKMFEEQIK